MFAPRRPGLIGVAGGALAGAAFLVWMAGASLLDPRRIDWLMKLDWVPHYFGWHYFRIEPWHWPPGTITGYYAPLGTSIGLTDAIPLAAYLLKPLDPWLPPAFQYIGAWWLLCFTLQGALGARLVARATPHALLQVLGASLFVLLPTLLVRVGHAALCSHWLILWALLIATREPPGRARPGEWTALGLCAGLVQPYLAAMALALLAAITLDGRGAPMRPRLAALTAAVGATATGWWLSGLFVLAGEGALAAGGLGYFSMNLLALVTPQGWSRVLPEWPVATDGQIYEGFHYLGLGVLLFVLGAAVIAMVRRAHGPLTGRTGGLAWAAALAMTAFAVSPVVTIGSRVLVDVSGPWLAPLAMFRSSGRFVWPLTYLVLAWAATSLIRRVGVRTAAAALALAVAVQLYDLQDAHASRRQTARDPAFQAWPRRFLSPQWAEIGLARHLVLVPPPQCGTSPVPYEAAVRLAADLRMSVNAGVIARGDDGARRRYCAELATAIDGARLEAGHVYIVDAAVADRLAATLGGRVRCVERDAIWACTPVGGDRLGLRPSTEAPAGRTPG